MKYQVKKTSQVRMEYLHGFQCSGMFLEEELTGILLPGQDQAQPETVMVAASLSKNGANAHHILSSRQF